MALSDSIFIIETEIQVTVVVDNTHFINYPINAHNPRRSDEFYAIDAINKIG